METCLGLEIRRTDGTDSLITAPSTSAFPRLQLGQLLHYQFRGLLSVYSRYDLQTRQVAYATLYTGGSGGFVASTAAPIATGWSDPVPGAGLSPTVVQRFSRRTVNACIYKRGCQERFSPYAGGADFLRDIQPLSP